LVRAKKERPGILPGRHFTNARASHPPWLFLVHFLSGANGSAWSRIQTAARSLDFGLGSALAPRPGLCHRGAVLCNIISNDGARRTMQDALAGRCLGRQPEEDGQNTQQTWTHPGVFLLQIDRGEKEPDGSARAKSHNAGPEARLCQAYQARELCGLPTVKVSQRQAKMPPGPG
jgi:hypothetical protein